MPALTDANPPIYNGYQFPLSVQTVQFDQVPVWDEADRTTLYVTYRIGLQWHINADIGSNIDSTMATLRQTLMQRGKAFTYQSRGFGADFVVGPGQTYEDVKGGPKPVAFSFKPKGKNQGCTITWTVELSLPSHCSYSVFGAIMTFNYKMGLRYDRHGYCVRTISGFIAIPKLATLEQVYNADSLLESVVPPIPAKFQRTGYDIDHNYDKTRTDFNFVDEELTTAAFPPGCTDASASHEVGSSFSRGFMQWDGSISGRYVVAPPYRFEVAWTAFKNLVKHRLDIINANLDNGTFNGDEKLQEQKPKQKPIILLTSLKITEPEIYKSTSVNIAVTYKQASTLKAIIGDTEIGTGQFRFPITGYEAWANWITSINNAAAFRGLSQMRLNPSDEAIVDLCTGDNAVAVPQQQVAFGDGDIFGPIGDITDLQPDPDPDTSWFLYESEIEVYDEFHGVVSSSLIEDTWKPYEGSPGSLSDLGYTPDTKPDDPTDSVQYRAPSTLTIYIAGQATRAWFPIHRPKIVSWGGMQVKEVSTQEDGCFWRQKNVGSLGIGMPIYYAEWRFKYIVEVRPAEPIRPPASLAEQN